jgi:hypothetical protein
MKKKQKKIDNESFHRVWEVMKETYEEERHFNNLETQYRILASQWLLGAFAAIGFVVVSNPTLSFNKLWLVVAIAVISGVGIFQLWRMDITIYQRLLGAVFNEGIELEKKFDFLPKIKTRMKKSVPKENVTDVLFYYYYISIVFFAVVALGVSIYLLNKEFANWILISVPFVLIFLLGLLHEFMRNASRERNQANIANPENVDNSFQNTLE